MSQEYDVIVIGSGIGGLATASLLAQLKHQKVLVLEQHFKVGGFTHTFSRHNYKFDVSSSVRESGGSICSMAAKCIYILTK